MQTDVVEVFDSHSLWMRNVKSRRWIADSKNVLEILHRLEVDLDKATEWGFVNCFIHCIDLKLERVYFNPLILI
jgi:hypothetical protein